MCPLGTLHLGIVPERSVRDAIKTLIRTRGGVDWKRHGFRRESRENEEDGGELEEHGGAATGKLSG